MTLSILARLRKLTERTKMPEGIKYLPPTKVGLQSTSGFPTWQPTDAQLAAAKSTTTLFSLWQFVTMILDQGHAGSCTGNGWCGAYALQSCKKLGKAIWLSVLYVYWYERLRNGDQGSDSGAYIEDGAYELSERGAPDSSDYPYSDNQAKVVQQPPADLDIKAASHKILNPMRVAADIMHIKARLLAGFVVVFGFKVYQSFESSETLRTGVVKMPAPREWMVGGHCMYFIGFTDEAGNAHFLNPVAAASYRIRRALGRIAHLVKIATGFTALPTQLPPNCFIAVNSWGQVGDGGRFYMPYAFVMKYASDFHTFDDVTES